MELKNAKEALLNVANYLEAGLPNDAPRISHMFFDMAVGASVRECGAVACIGGLAWIWENPNDGVKEASKYVGDLAEDDPLIRLYYPNVANGYPNVPYYMVTPVEAAKAIRRYFYGEARFWDHVGAIE